MFFCSYVLIPFTPLSLCLSLTFCSYVFLSKHHFAKLSLPPPQNRIFRTSKAHTKKKNDFHVFAKSPYVTPTTIFAYFLHKNEAYNAQTSEKQVNPKEDSPFIVPS